MKKKEVNKDIINLDDDLTFEDFQQEMIDSKKEVVPKEVELVALEDTVEIDEEIKARETKLNDPEYDFSLIDKKARKKKEQQEVIEDKNDEVTFQEDTRETKLNDPEYDFS